MFKDFDIEKVKGRPKLNRTVSCRITEAEYQWLVKNHVSATKLLRYCLKNVMENGNSNQTTTEEKSK